MKYAEGKKNLRLAVYYMNCIFAYLQKRVVLLFVPNNNQSTDSTVANLSLSAGWENGSERTLDLRFFNFTGHFL